MSRRVVFPNLDALRFLAFFAVFIFHSFHTADPGLQAHPILVALSKLKQSGSMGVNFFFVLSGFLITFLLLEEQDQRGAVDIRAFYMRRALRIWPLYFLILVIGFVLFPQLKAWLGQMPSETATPWKYILFVGNFDIIADGQLPDASVLGVLWSLAVEEQFYLVWPLLLTVVPSRHFPKLFLVVIAACCVYRAVHLNDSLRLTFSTFAVCSDLVVGALLAVHTHRPSVLVQRLRGLSRGVILAIYLVGFATVIWLHHLELNGNSPLTIVSRLVISVFFAFVIWEQNEAANSPLKLGRFRSLSALGKISYGLYCLHFVGILVALQLNRMVIHLQSAWWHVVFVETALALTITIVISALCYRHYEQPFLRLKSGFSRLEPVPAMPPSR
jgi:peptidoglycan/LPS O-acetylase OafA/YrhL